VAKTRICSTGNLPALAIGRQAGERGPERILDSESRFGWYRAAGAPEGVALRRPGSEPRYPEDESPINTTVTIRSILVRCMEAV
jgi:hypothetical protein